MQQGVQMDATSSIQQCRVHLQGPLALCLVLTRLFCVVPLSPSVTRNITSLLSKVENLDYFENITNRGGNNQTLH